MKKLTEKEAGASYYVPESGGHIEYVGGDIYVDTKEKMVYIYKSDYDDPPSNFITKKGLEKLLQNLKSEK